jgi:predicted ribonuclease YlaK
MEDYSLSRHKKLYITSQNLVAIEPVGAAQQKAFAAYSEDKNLFLTGSAGTGKTFILLHLAFKEVLDKSSPYDRVIIVRSLLPSRDIGFLPGTLDEKANLYQDPYRILVRYLFEMPNEQEFTQLYDKLVGQGSLEFYSTSFLRGQTFDRSIIIVDEASNLLFQELDTIMTRVGQNSKIMFAGDMTQSDLRKNNGEQDGYHNFQVILDGMDEFEVIEFGIGDIIRSGLVRSYLIAKTNMGIKSDSA